MGLSVGTRRIMGVYVGEEPVILAMYQGEEVWPLGIFGGKIIYAHRYASLQSYDQAFIDKMRAYGFTVTPLFHENIFAVDFEEEEIEWLVIGAPGTSSTGVYRWQDVDDLPVNIVSLCRFTAVSGLNLATSHGTRSLSSYTINETEHEVALWDYSVGQSVSIGPSTTNHYITTPTSGSTIVAASGSYPGLVAKDAGDYRRAFWGYYRFDLIYETGSDLFREILRTRYAVRGVDFVATWDGIYSDDLINPKISTLTEDGRSVIDRDALYPVKISKLQELMFQDKD